MAATPKGTTFLTVGNLRTQLAGDVPAGLIDEATSCYKTGYAFTGAFKRRDAHGRRVWDGKIHLLAPITKTLPTGAVPMAIEALKVGGYTGRLRFTEEAKPLPVTGNWNRPYFFLKDRAWHEPRDYQIESVEAVIRGNAYIGQKGVVRVPTAGGKTLIAAMLCEAFGVSTIILVHGQNLVDQTRAELASFLGEDRVGLVMASEWNPKIFTVTSVDTIAKRLVAKDPRVVELMRAARMVIADEAHRIGGGKLTFQKAMDFCANAAVRIGLSGTPFKKTQDTDLLLMSRTGTLLYDIPPTRLQQEGRLAMADLQIYEVTEPEANELTYQEAMATLVYGHPARTEFIVKKAMEHAESGKSILLIAGNSVAYVKNLKEEWERQARVARSKGRTIPQATFVTGKSGRERVGEAVTDLRTGRISLLCNTVLFDEGTDIPAIDVVILASPTKSFVKVMQRIGRGLRVKASGGKLLVIDVLDSNNPYLVKHFQSRLKFYESEGIFDRKEHAFAGLTSELLPKISFDSALELDEEDS